LNHQDISLVNNRLNNLLIKSKGIPPPPTLAGVAANLNAIIDPPYSNKLVSNNINTKCINTYN
jgi:hypothetical protein